MKITRSTKPATPWNVTIAKLVAITHKVEASESEGLEARWAFGCELGRHLVEYKGRKGVPADLMTLTIERCHIGKAEVAARLRFAQRYPNKKLMSDAVRHYPSWHQMVHEGLVEKKRDKPKRKASPPSVSTVVRKLAKVLEAAFAQQPTLSREDVRAIEDILTKVQAILEQVDQNDKAKAS